MLRIIANLSKLHRRTALQCAFNKGCYCSGDAQSIPGCGQPGMSRGPGGSGGSEGPGAPRLTPDAWPLILDRGAPGQRRKLFAVHGAWAGNVLMFYVTVHSQNITNRKAFIKTFFF